MSRKSAFAIVAVVVLLCTILSATLIYFLVTTEEKPSKTIPGEFGVHFVSSKEYTQMIVEVDYIMGCQPSANSLNALESKIEDYTDKYSVDIILSDEIPSSDYYYSVNEIEALEEEHRDYYWTENCAVLYYLYLNSLCELSPDAIGITYDADSIAIFKELIETMAYAYSVAEEVIETPVIVHELGHALGLVNVGYESTANHEDTDPGRSHHCIHENCVMYWQISGSHPPSDFCYDCRNDSQQIKNINLEVKTFNYLIFIPIILVIVGIVIATVVMVLGFRQAKEEIYIYY